ncbi:MAG: hypothetical protein ND895_28600 [Pyrinomonadaceae bacterium]|nr:hypothetical protein [Pyrinomonadaceae bacterium]
MILPMMGFFFVMMLLGGIGSIAVMVDDHAARKAVVPFTVFFSGLGVYVMVFGLGFLGSFFNSSWADSLAFFAGPVVGSVGGGLLGYRLGIKRRRRAPEQST